MLPHCDTLDGPVVTAAREALEEEELNLMLPFVSDSGEDEIREAFAKVLEALGQLAGGTAGRYGKDYSLKVLEEAMRKAGNEGVCV